MPISPEYQLSKQNGDVKPIFDHIKDNGDFVINNIDEFKVVIKCKKSIK